MEPGSPALQAASLPSEPPGYIMWNARLDEAQDRIKIARRNINNLRYANDIFPYSRKWRWRGTSKPLDESEREEWKSWLKTQHSKTKILAYSPITSWKIDGETMETVRDFIFGGSRITAHADCSHEIKRCFLLGRKAMTKLDSILESRDVTLPTKACLVKAMVFPVVMYTCESWTIKKAEWQRIDAFEL